MSEKHVTVVDAADNVGTLLRDCEEGETLDITVGDDVVSVTFNDDVQFGHKVAIEDIPEGETVYKYGVSIGYASTDISQGDWVHVHNVDSNYGRGDLAAENEAQAVSD